MGNTRGARLSQLGGRRNWGFRGPVHNSGSGCAFYVVALCTTAVVAANIFAAIAGLS